MWTPVMHVRNAGARETGVIALTKVCQQVLNGDAPPVAMRWLAAHKLVLMEKESHHQAYLDDRLAAALGQTAGESTLRARPLAVGDAILRVAERALVKQETKAWISALMPYQFGVGVPGGINIWTSVVEAHLQLHKSDVMVSIDLQNCFNEIDRDALITALLADARTAPLARYVAATYPPGMAVKLDVMGGWEDVIFDRGLAQGRPLSPALASFLL